MGIKSSQAKKYSLPRQLLWSSVETAGVTLTIYGVFQTYSLSTSGFFGETIPHNRVYLIIELYSIIAYTSSF